MQTEQETGLGAYARLILEHQPVATALFDAKEFCLLAANPAYQSLLSPQLQHGQAIIRDMQSRQQRPEVLEELPRILRQLAFEIRRGMDDHRSPR